MQHSLPRPRPPSPPPILFNVMSIIIIIAVHALLGWDRPVYGKIAAMQIVKIKDTYDKVRASLLLPTRPVRSFSQYNINSVYDKYLPRVLDSLSSALMVESKDEGQLLVCLCA